MPQVAQVKSSKHKGAVASFVIGLVVILLVIAAIVFVFWLFVPSVASDVKKAEDLNTSGDYQQALNILKPDQFRAISKNDREGVYTALGRTEFNLGNYSASVTAYQKAVSIVPGQDSTLSQLQSAAQDAGNNAAELDADKQLLPVLQAKDTGPTRQNDINLLQQQIAELSK